MHYRARQYDPKIGRFISEDPIGFAGGDVNLYGYVRNMPLWFRDPTGLQPGADVMAYPPFWQAVAAAGGAIAAAASSTAIVAGGGLAIGIGIGYYPGQWTANHPSNPFVNGPWNPFGTPFPNQSETWSRPKPTSPPYCETGPKAIPFFNWPPREFPIPLGPYPPQTPDLHERCMDKCEHLIGIGDNGAQFQNCYRRCMGRIS